MADRRTCDDPEYGHKWVEVTTVPLMGDGDRCRWGTERVCARCGEHGNG